MKIANLTRLLAVSLEVAVIAAMGQLQQAWGDDASARGGERIFQAMCTPCHTIGHGKRVGPDLKGVTAIRSHEWLEKFISTPDRVLAGGDPVANRLVKEYGGIAMPNLGLSRAQVEALLGFLAEGAPPPPAASAAVPTDTVPGHPDQGQTLFTGVISFQRGGAPCLACHTVSGIAPLGGGSLGPDLTGIYGRLGPAGLDSLLATLPFPTMRPIFRDRPLTPGERRDLAALFQVAAGRQPIDTSQRIVVLAVAGCVLLLLLAGVVWRTRLRSVRRSLVATTSMTGGCRR